MSRIYRYLSGIFDSSIAIWSLARASQACPRQQNWAWTSGAYKYVLWYPISLIYILDIYLMISYQTYLVVDIFGIRMIMLYPTDMFWLYLICILYIIIIYKYIYIASVGFGSCNQWIWMIWPTIRWSVSNAEAFSGRTNWVGRILSKRSSREVNTTNALKGTVLPSNRRPVIAADIGDWHEWFESDKLDSQNFKAHHILDGLLPENAVSDQSPIAREGDSKVP